MKVLDLMHGVVTFVFISIYLVTSAKIFRLEAIWPPTPTYRAMVKEPMNVNHKSENKQY